MRFWMRVAGTRLLPLLLLAAGVAGCDQVTKAQALYHLTETFVPAGGSVRALGFSERVDRWLRVRHPRSTGELTVLSGFWRLRYVENPGASWNLLRDLSSPWRERVLLTVSLLIMAMMLVWLRRAGNEPLTSLGLALALGGALGNLLDRARLGYVVDFIQWHWRDELYWPVFNIADAAISSGVALLLLQTLLPRRPPDTPRATTSP
jgi:signal peptidase II